MDARATWATAAAVAMLPFWPAPAGGQIPDEFTNLTVLDQGMSRPELIGLMRSFSFDLGVRCNFCHVGEDPADLTGYDFASDEREPKRVARGMMRMVSRINSEHIPDAGRTDGTQVGCGTCHRGVSNPIPVQDVFLDVLDGEGLDAAVARYRELRDAYFGRAAYDFGLPPLRNLTETLAGQGRLDEALGVAVLTTTFHPEDVQAHAIHADVLWRAGEREAAIQAMERALSLDPESEFLRQTLERMRAGG